MLIRVPTEKKNRENETRWQRIHEILRTDAKKRLKENTGSTLRDRRIGKLLTLLVEQKEFVGEIGTWMPSKEARDKLLELGLIEDAFVTGGFRDWFANEVPRRDFTHF